MDNMSSQIQVFQSGLNKYVEAVFHFSAPPKDYTIERFLPTGHVFLVFELNDETQYVYDNVTLHRKGNFNDVFICGMQRHYLSISRHNGSDIVAIQFRAVGAYPFLHYPIANLSDKVVSAKGILGEDVFELRDELKRNKGMEARFALIENWLLQQYNADKAPPPELIRFEQIMRDAPFASLKEIIEAYPRTQKSLIQQFKKYLGLSPKYYQRILRFNAIMRILTEQENNSWAEVAYMCGYADQSHFIKEFKFFSSFKPNEFRKHKPEPMSPFFFLPLDI